MLENERVTIRRLLKFGSSTGNSGPAMRMRCFAAGAGGLVPAVEVAVTSASVGVTISAISIPSLSGHALSKAGNRIVPTGPRYWLPLRGALIFGTYSLNIARVMAT